MREQNRIFRGIAVPAAVFVLAALTPVAAGAQTASTTSPPSSTTTEPTTTTTAPTTTTTAPTTTTTAPTTTTTTTSPTTTTVTTTPATTATTAGTATTTDDSSSTGPLLFLALLAVVGLIVLGILWSRRVARQSADVARWDGRRDSLLVETRGLERSTADFLARWSDGTAVEATWPSIREQGDRVRENLRVLAAGAPDPERAASAQEVVDAVDVLMRTVTLEVGQRQAGVVTAVPPRQAADACMSLLTAIHDAEGPP